MLVQLNNLISPRAAFWISCVSLLLNLKSEKCNLVHVMRACSSSWWPSKPLAHVLSYSSKAVQSEVHRTASAFPLSLMRADLSSVISTCSLQFFNALTLAWEERKITSTNQIKKIENWEIFYSWSSWFFWVCCCRILRKSWQADTALLVSIKS